MSTNDVIARLDAAVSALGDVDVSGWDDTVLAEHLDDLSAALVAVDGQLARLADAVRARGLRVVEPSIAA
ncbi:MULTISPECIES: hypothetical protein [Catenuloplanes]|uniref:Uncharacterized protein n=1 Tax=Catenuloplanes niger TaxID=587534 RepID=A0AAE3ZQR6_9ACTN|nr:hypothetical protein [Catenuloplanes niger]MDR7322140.1 hypothetical protein [Catenuloplanes niger]